MATFCWLLIIINCIIFFFLICSMLFWIHSVHSWPPYEQCNTVLINETGFYICLSEKRFTNRILPEVFFLCQIDMSVMQQFQSAWSKLSYASHFVWCVSEGVTEVQQDIEPVLLFHCREAWPRSIILSSSSTQSDPSHTLEWLESFHSHLPTYVKPLGLWGC